MSQNTGKIAIAVTASVRARTRLIGEARRWAASLEKKGYLEREMRVGTTNRFHLKGLMDALVSLKKAMKPKEQK